VAAAAILANKAIRMIDRILKIKKECVRTKAEMRKRNDEKRVTIF
jgi:hypothetical protein